MIDVAVAAAGLVLACSTRLLWLRVTERRYKRSLAARYDRLVSRLDAEDARRVTQRI